jgi:hypothetical protein
MCIPRRLRNSVACASGCVESLKRIFFQKRQLPGKPFPIAAFFVKDNLIVFFFFFVHGPQGVGQFLNFP